MKFKSNIEVQAGIEDSVDKAGTAGQLLSSLGPVGGVDGVEWIDQIALSAGSAESVEIPVKNLEGSALTKGDPVYISGSVGASGILEVGLANAGVASKMPAVGILKQDLAANGEGLVVVTGKLRNLITSPIDGVTPAANTVIYVKSGGTTGAALTTVKPGGSANLIQNMGKVGRPSTSSDGTLVVSSILRTNDVPNLPVGRLFVGTNDNTSLTSDVVYIDDTAGNVGIGTASPDPNYKLDVNGDILADNARFTGFGVSWGSFTGGSRGAQLENWPGSRSVIRSEEPQIRFYMGRATTGVGVAMVLTDTGNVGIGTTSPSSRLDIRTSGVNDGLNLATSQPVNFAKIFNGNSESFPVGNLHLGYGSNTTAVIQALGNSMALKGGYTTGGLISFSSASTEVMRMTSTGLGIGTTSPGAKLDVKGAGSSGTTKAFNVENANATTLVSILDNGNINQKLVGFKSTSFGTDAGKFATSPYFTTFGNSAGGASTTNGYWTAVGASAGASSTTGQSWGAFGFFAGRLNTTGSYWNAIGSNAGEFNTGGSNWIAMGYGAARFYSGGTTTASSFSNGVYIGNTAKVGAAGAQNEIVIGYEAEGIGSNSVVLGNDSITTTVLKGNVGIGTASPQSTRKLDVAGHIQGSQNLYLGVAGTNSSTNSIEIGQGRTGNGFAYMDLTGDATYSDFGLRIIRNNTGANTSSEIIHRGTGDFSITTYESADILLIPNSGNVGIGTTSPRGKLDITNGSTGQNYSNISGLLIDVNGTSNSYYGLRVGSSTGNSHLAVTNAGNVGIGTASPGANLEVAGNANIGAAHTNYGSAEYNVNLGFQNYNNGFAAIATGQNTLADADVSFSMGYKTIARGVASFAGGNEALGALGIVQTEAIGTASLAFGSGVTTSSNAFNSQAFGRETVTGGGTQNAYQAMAIGYQSRAWSDNSFAGGNNSDAFGQQSFAFGAGATASAGDSNIALGLGVTTNNNGTSAAAGQVVVGKWNDYTSGVGHSFAVGTGSSNSSRYTAFCVRDTGYVGIGTTSPGSELDVVGISRFTHSSSTSYRGAIETVVDNAYPTWGIGWLHARASSSTYGNIARFDNENGSQIGGISYSGTSGTSFVTTSDYRLKENIEEISDSISRVKKLKPCRFNFTAEKNRVVDGFIAHEVQKVVPEAVHGKKDALQEDGSIDAQTLEASRLIPVLTKALQEAIAKIEQLETRIQTLENK